MFSLSAAARLPADEVAFFAARPTLRLLEQRLPAGSTLAVPEPADPAAHLASDAVVDETLRALLADFLAPPATFANQASPLVAELCATRPQQAALWVGTASSVYLSGGLERAEENLVRAVSAGVTAAPSSAPHVVRAALASISLAAESRGRGQPPLAQATAAVLMNRVVATGIGAVRIRSGASTSLFYEILGEALRLARAESSPTILVEAIAATVTAADGLAGLSPGEIARFAFAEAAPTRDDAGLVCAAVLRAAGPAAANAVRDQAAMTLPLPFAAFVTLTTNAFVSVAETPDSPAAGIARSITVRNGDFISAFMIGAIVSKPDAAVDIMLAGLNRDSILRGRSTTSDILLASLRAAPARSAELAAAAVGRGDLGEGNPPALIAEAIARGAPPSRVAEALAAQIRAQPATAGILQATVAGALSGSTLASRLLGQGAIVRAMVRASGRSAEVLEQAIVSAPREAQHRAALGVLAADPAQAPALLQRALAHPALDAGQAAPLAAAGGLIVEIQRDPALFFPATLRRLAAPENAAPEIAIALLEAAALANPRGAHALAAAFAVRPGAPSSATLRAIAAQGNRAIAAELEPAVLAALAVAEQEAAAGNFIRGQIALLPGSAAEIVAGATAARPALAAVIGEAAAQAAPASAGAITRNLFAFSGARHPLAPTDETAEAHAATLIASVLRGVAAAGLDADAGPIATADAIADAIADAAAAAVRCVFALARNPAEPGALPAPSVVAAVIASAARSAPAHALAIARATAFATRSLAGAAAPPALVRDAVLSGDGTADAGEVAAAVATGFDDSDRQMPAASARILSDYSFDSLTGPAMTRYLDL